ncbi:MAG: hypothetical protein H6585_00240 [Flavobacteriales bacterium]|nr:hypothetical protein [Flavobacteriales bacterium]MCB9446753.1 hypothetical protein [Flavobacteriales bacterium]
MRKNRSLLLCGVLCLSVAGAFAQDDLMDMLDSSQPKTREDVTATFKTTRVLSGQSVETVRKGGLDFRVTHRFGNMGGASGGGVHTLYGFDQASNIRLSLEYGLTDHLMAGFGRSKMNEHLDFFVKWRFLRQTTDNAVPVSMVWYSNMAINPSGDPQGLWTKWVHRLSYTHQAILARKFSPSFSAQLMPTLVHRNFVLADAHPVDGSQDMNNLFSLGGAFRLKFTKRAAIVVEYFQTFSAYRHSNTADPYYAPLAIGLEIETGGHIFHVNLSNTAGIIENDFIPTSPDSWGKGGMKLGFTISRVFQLKQ